MNKKLLTMAAMAAMGAGAAWAQPTVPADPFSAKVEDNYADTWVATDALGRTMPTNSEVGNVKTDKDRVVGIFYITWHTMNKGKGNPPYYADITKILKEDPSARLDGTKPAWHKIGEGHWGEPECGYFLSQDPWVMRRDISMLADAGVDVLILDVTNAVHYWDEWDVLFKTMRQMKAEGNKVPKFCFWSFNGPAISVVQKLYERYYKTNSYRDLWFYWNGKPLLLYNANPRVDANGKHDDKYNKNPNYDPKAATDVDNPHYGDPEYCNEFYTDYTQEVRNFFTLRNMWWGYYEWADKRFVGTEGNWSFGYQLNDPKVAALSPNELVAKCNGELEEAAVTPAQHPISETGKCWRRDTQEPTLDKWDMPAEAYVPWLGKKVKDPVAYGIYYQDRWDEALKSDPKFIYLNDWNEWTAGKYPASGFLSRKSNFMFVDQYNAEFNRTISPMKGGYTDNYYMQTVQNIRRYKGVRPIPEGKGVKQIGLGDFDAWKTVTPTYYDTKGDVTHRDFPGYSGLHYTDNSGRNDIAYSKVAFDGENVLFYVETVGNLTPSTDPNWMLLLIDADQNHSTGWNGYDYIVNKQVKDGATTTLMRWGGKSWKKCADVKYGVNGNKLVISIPMKALKLGGGKVSFDFHWSDNPKSLDDIISLCTTGDNAPNRRFNYRCIWSK